MKKKLHIILLFAIVLCAFLVRITLINYVPPGLNRDEAALGYNAYSILKTAHDEHGVSLPVSFKSFGDWKLPLYIYILTPFVSIFGLNDSVVRFPSVLLGSLSIILVYMMCLEIWEKSKNRYNYALVSAFILGLMPWHIFFSRVASEANLAMFLVLLGVFLFLKARQKSMLIIPSFISLALSMWAYHGNHIFTPLLFVGLFVSYWKNIRKNPYAKFAVPLFVILAGIVVSETLFVADKTKISGLLPVSDPAEVHTTIDLPRNRYEHMPFVGKVFYNKLTFLNDTIIGNYVKGFSPEFLFISGGSNAQHNIQGVGNLYLWQAAFFVLGLYALSKDQYMRDKKILVWWMLIAPVAASITKDAPHSARMYAFLPIPAIVIAAGIVWVWFFVSRYTWSRLFFFLSLSAVIALSAIFYIDRYFVQFPYYEAANWGNGYKTVFEKLATYKKDYGRIIIDNPDRSPYIYYVFYNQSDPDTFQKQAKHYPDTSEGFSHIESFDGVSYKDIDWADEVFTPDGLLIGFSNEIFESATDSAILITPDIKKQLQEKGIETAPIGSLVRSEVIDTVYLPDGSPQFYFIRTFIDDSKKLIID